MSPLFAANIHRYLPCYYCCCCLLNSVSTHDSTISCRPQGTWYVVEGRDTLNLRGSRRERYLDYAPGLRGLIMRLLLQQKKHPVMFGVKTQDTCKICTWSRCAFMYHIYFYNHSDIPAQLVGGFTIRVLLDKPWSQVSSLFPPRYVPSFLSRIRFTIPTARRFSSNVASSRSRAFRYVINFYARCTSTCTW